MYSNNQRINQLLSMFFVLVFIIAVFGFIQPLENTSDSNSNQNTIEVNNNNNNIIRKDAGSQSQQKNLIPGYNNPFIKSQRLADQMVSSNTSNLQSATSIKKSASSNLLQSTSTNQNSLMSLNSISSLSSSVTQYSMNFNTTHFTWYDAVTNGYDTGIYGDDVGGAYNLSFGFSFYGTVFSTVYISTNGYLSFNNTYPTSTYSSTFPTSDYYVIAPFWCDLVTSSSIYAWNTSSFAVIEFPDMQYYAGGTAGTFEVVLFDNDSILFNYLYMNIDNSATVGLNYGLNTNYYNSYIGDLSFVNNTELYFLPSAFNIADSGNLTYLQGDTGNTITWTATNNNPNNYTILLDGVVNETGLWTSGTPIIINVDGLSAGYYTFTMVMEDASGNIVYDSVYVTVTAPIAQYHMVLNATNFGWFDAVANGYDTGIYGDDVGGAYTLPFSFSYYGTPFSTVYISTNGYLSFSDTDPTSTYSSTFPTSDYYVIAPFWCDLVTSSSIYAWSTSSFAVIEFPNMQYFAGGTAGTFEVVLFNNGSILFNYQYMNIDNSATVGLNYGLNTTYYTAYTGDLSFVNNTEMYFATQNLPPYHDLGVDLQAPTGLLIGSSTIINATVYNQGNQNETNIPFSLLIDGTSVYSTTIPSILTGSNYTVHYNWIQPTSANYNITAYVQPVINETTTYNNIMTEFSYVGSAVITGNIGDYFTLVFNSSSFVESLKFTFTQYIDSSHLNMSVYETYIDLTSYGSTSYYSFWMDINTVSRFIENGTIWAGTYFLAWVQPNLNVSDHLNVFTDSSANVTSQFNYVWNQITYNVYNITFQVSGIVYYGIYDSNTGLMLNLGGFTSGFLNDSSLLTVNPVIMDLQIPVITDSGSVSYTQGATGNYITWNATDNNPDNYSILFNGIVIDTGIWASGNPILLNVDGLSAGTYTYTLEVSDYSGHLVSDTVYVWVYASSTSGVNQYGLLVNSTPFNWYDAISFGYSLNIIGDDISGNLSLPFSFTFYDLSFTTVYISSNGYLSFNDPNPTIYSNPSFPDFSNDYVIAPFWTDLYSNNSIYAWTTSQFAVIEFLNIPLTSGSNIGTFEVVLYNDGTILFNYLNLSNQQYVYPTIGLNYGIDTTYYTTYSGLNAGLNHTSMLFSTASDQINNGVISNPADITYTAGTEGHNVRWYVNEPGSYTVNIYRNGQLVDNFTSQGSIVDYNVDGLTTGGYNFTLEVSYGGYQYFDTVQVTVQSAPNNPGGISTTTTQVTTSTSSASASTTSSNSENPRTTATIHNSPGFELLIFIFGFIGAYFFRKRKL